MSITVIYNRKETEHSFSITRSTFIFVCILIVAILMTSAWLLQSHYHQQLTQHKIQALSERDLIKQQYLDTLQSQTNQQVQALAVKIGQLQAQSIRLNNLGERIVDKSNFPKEEFEFDINQYIDQGLILDADNLDKSLDQSSDQSLEQNLDQNVESDNEQVVEEAIDHEPIDNISANAESVDEEIEQPVPLNVVSNVKALDTSDLAKLHKNVSLLAYQYQKNQNLLQQLEITLTNLHLTDELFISGRPVPIQGSWISSPFGTRTDPFTGRLRRHKGVDIAGHTGMPINATAAGVVTTSEARTGYGYVVEINHGSGLRTRYAHASSLLVAVGAVVEKGQQIAVMGTTGRSTGPHVHYEVIKDGTQIDPVYYIQRLPS